MIRVCMIAYTNYAYDARVRREAEAIAGMEGYEVTVLPLKQGPVAKTYQDNGVVIKELNLKKYEGESIPRYVFFYLVYMLLAGWDLAGRLLRRQLDVVHVHNMPNFLIFSALLPLVAGKKVVLDVHDTLIETYATKFNSSFFMKHILFPLLVAEERISALFAHRIICVNHTQKEILVKRGLPRRKITVILNVPDPEYFQLDQGGSRGSDDNGTFDLVYHGTLSHRLGVDLAFKAVKELESRISGLNLLVLGDGEAKEDLIRLCGELDLEKKITIHPLVPLRELVTILRTKDLEIISNRRNIATQLMLPVKLLECVALGIAVVVPRLETIQYYFREDMLFYFDPEDFESLVSAIMLAYTDPDERRLRAERAMEFLDIYGWDKHGQDLIDLYLGLTI